MASYDRQQDTLKRCKTDAQRARVEQAHADDLTAYVQTRSGKGVVSEAKRWFETGDIAKFGNGLYDFSIYALNEIAHFDLHGFRATFPHPALWIDQVLIPEARAVGHVERHSVNVYTDGMTYGDVLTEILRLAAEHRDRLVRDANEKHRVATLAEARRLADSVGFELVAKGGA